jgi:peptidylprolyl isomerase
MFRTRFASITRGLEAEYQPVAYEKDYYAILQVSRNAKQEDIEKAYARLSSVFDPASSNKKRAAERHAEVSAAYDVLRDPSRRRQYDRQLASGGLASTSVMRAADVLGNRYVMLGSGIVLVTVLIILGLVVLVGGGGSSESVADTSATATAAATATAGPTQTPPASPPDVTGTPTTLADGLQYIITTPGAGTAAASGDTVTVQYSGWLQDTGALFDSSYTQGVPFTFQLGNGQVIPGWDEGVAGMLPGEKRRLIVPPALAYGDAGSGSLIPGGATLVFDVELQSAATPTPGQTPEPTAAPSPPDITGTTVTLPDGLQYTIFQRGTGDGAHIGQTVTVNYSGWVQATGALFDSSLQPSRTPFQFTLGADEVIKGWEEGVAGMKIGEKRRLVIPPEIGYGAISQDPIPPNSTLIFDIQLLRVDFSTATAAP